MPLPIVYSEYLYQQLVPLPIVLYSEYLYQQLVPLPIVLYSEYLYQQLSAPTYSII